MNRQRPARRIPSPLGWIVALVLFASACGSSSGLSTTSPDDEAPVGSEATAVPTHDDLFLCEDVPSLETSLTGLLGSRANPDDLLMGVIYTYAQENLDTYAGLWIDRENDGVIAVAFTDDPESHRTELLRRGPKETDDVGIEPPPPITDARTLGDRDDFVFEVIQATHTETTLMDAQNNLNSLFGTEGTGLSGSSVDTIRNIVSLELIDPTPAGLDLVADAIADEPVCVNIFVSPEPPSGELDIIAAPGEPFELPDGLGEVRWELDPAFPIPMPGDTEIHVLATETDCASGRDMGEALRGPQVQETETEVIIAFAVEALFGGADCQGNPSTPVTVTLDAPLGDRTINDAADPTRQPVMGENDVPTVDQPAGGDGWRMISSTLFIDGWNGPLAATTLEEFWLLTDTFWEADLDPTVVDFDNEIVVAQTVIKQLGDDQQCGPHVMDNVRIDDGAFTYDITSPLHVEGDPCIDPDGYQVFVVALDRETLPDTIRLPNRNALIEIQVR